ncbi:MAG: hypothetical protein WBW16_11165 [Bacteroidota bacterium]
MKRRKSIPPLIEAEVLIQSRRRCALCFGLNKNQEERTGQIAHIDQNSSNNSFSNLVFLCLDHHDSYDSRTSQSKGYTATELRHYREELYKSLGSNLALLKEETVRVSLKDGRVDNEMLEYLWDEIYELVFAALVPSEDIVAEVIEMYSDDYDANVILPYVVTITEKLLAEHAKQQKAWPAITDCDRLDAAFEELERNGIVCRQDFADCLSCGYNQIWDEIKKVEEGGRQVRGFTFYHMQDTAHAIQDGDIYLGYGSKIDDDATDLDIASEVASTIRRHGLKVVWNNSIRQRIGVILDWKKRR